MDKKVLYELNGKSIMILLELIKNAPNPISPHTIARNLGTDKTTIHSNLKELQAKDYIIEDQHITCSPDATLIYYKISKKGMKLLSDLFDSLFPYYRRETIGDNPQKAIEYFKIIQSQFSGKK